MATEGGAGFLTRREAVGLACAAVGAAALAGSPAVALADAAAGVAPGVADPAIPVTLTAAEWAVSADGSSIAFGIDATNHGDAGYFLVRAGIDFYDTAGKVLASEPVELPGWLPAGGTVRHEVSVPLPAGAYSFLISAPTSAESGDVWDFPSRGLRLTCGPAVPSDTATSAPAVLENAGDVAYSLVELAVRALDGDGFVVGSAPVEAVGPQDEPLEPDESREVALEVPFGGAARLFVEGVSSAEPADAPEQEPKTVLFGRWPTSVPGGPEPIEWIVLARSGSRRLLLAKRGIDCKPFDENNGTTAWAACSLRAWLNGEFLMKAFDGDERVRIAEVALRNGDNPDSGTPGGPDTLDRVFCLSIDELGEYFDYVPDFKEGAKLPAGVATFATGYAVTNGAWTDEDTGRSPWWLRSPGYLGGCVTFVYADGLTETWGDHVDASTTAVRPAIWVNDLPEAADESSDWSDESSDWSDESSDQPSVDLTDIVTFGSYPTSADGSVQPIEWVVVAREGSRTLLLARYGIDNKPYNDRHVSTTWSECSLRAWLNGEFLYSAFTADEMARIQVVELQNDDNPDYGTPGGPDTFDRVFCLSLDDIVKYFGAIPYPRPGNKEYADLYTTATDYAAANGALVSVWTGGTDWWLRSIGREAWYASCVFAGGAVHSGGYYVDSPDSGTSVRPAIWVFDL